ncbi:MAG: hypothetical protein KKB70_05650 [Proteobacteria bacterium]|nr:hypothetical protein [Pseudomonadota bacterium]
MKQTCVRSNFTRTCRLTHRPCDGPCGQFLSFDPDLYDELIEEVPTHTRKEASKLKPLSTFHMMMMANPSLASTVASTINREAVQGRLTIERVVARVQEKESSWGF